MPSEITSPAAYHSRRRWLQQLATGAAGSVLAAWAARDARASIAQPGRLASLPANRSTTPGAVVLDKPTAYADVTGYNNFYEFGTDKADPAARAGSLRPRPWTVVVDGEVARPRRFDLDELLRLAPMEERIYRLRCVEGWPMVTTQGHQPGLKGKMHSQVMTKTIRQCTITPDKARLFQAARLFH